MIENFTLFSCGTFLFIFSLFFYIKNKVVHILDLHFLVGLQYFGILSMIDGILNSHNNELFPDIFIAHTIPFLSLLILMILSRREFFCKLIPKISIQEFIKNKLDLNFSAYCLFLLFAFVLVAYTCIWPKHYLFLQEVIESKHLKTNHSHYFIYKLNYIESIFLSWYLDLIFILIPTMWFFYLKERRNIRYLFFVFLLFVLFLNILASSRQSFFFAIVLSIFITYLPNQIYNLFLNKKKILFSLSLFLIIVFLTNSLFIFLKTKNDYTLQESNIISSSINNLKTRDTLWTLISKISYMKKNVLEVDTKHIFIKESFEAAVPKIFNNNVKIQSDSFIAKKLEIASTDFPGSIFAELFLSYGIYSIFLYSAFILFLVIFVSLINRYNDTFFHIINILLCLKFLLFFETNLISYFVFVRNFLILNFVIYPVIKFSFKPSLALFRSFRC
jgi:hypothetical protein